MFETLNLEKKPFVHLIDEACLPISSYKQGLLIKAMKLAILLIKSGR